MPMKLDGDRSAALLLLLRKGKPRSKYYTLVCFGPKRHYRKDGTCKHTDELLNHHVKPDARSRVVVKRAETDRLERAQVGA